MKKPTRDDLWRTGRRAAAVLPPPLRRRVKRWGRRVVRWPVLAPAVQRLRPQPAVAVVPARLRTEPDMVAHLRSLRWVGDRLELRGWAHPRDGARATVSVTAVSGTGQRVPVEVTPTPDEEVNARDDEHARDRSWSAFTAVLDPWGWSQDRKATTAVSWALEVELSQPDRTLRGSFSGRDEWGSAGRLRSRGHRDGRWVDLSWSGSSGLVLQVGRAPLQGRARVGVDGAVEVVLTEAGRRARVRAVELRSDAGRTTLPVRRGVVRLDPDAAAIPSGGKAALVVTTAPGQTATVRCAQEPISVPAADGQVLRIGRDDDAHLSVTRSPVHLSVDWLSVADADGAAELRFGGVLSGRAEDLPELRLQGFRQQVPLRAEVGPDGSFTVSGALRSTLAWADAPTALLPGTYRLVAEGVDVEVAPAVTDRLPETHLHRELRVRAEARGAVLRVRVDPPRRTDELGAFHRKRLVAKQPRSVPVLEAVYFESFSGRSANDNSRAVFEELRRRNTGLRLIWGVSDFSVTTPAGSDQLLVGSGEWWQTVRRCRALVTNTWLTGNYRKPDHQYVLQTWHGTPYKTLGADRLSSRDRGEYLRQLAGTTNRWDALVVQNEYSAERLPAAYGYEGEVLRSGYPRNDSLVTATEGTRAALRRRLGLAEDEVAVLYAPTWREDDRTLNRGLDLQGLLARLGPGHRLLVRGHNSVVRHNREISQPGVLDVSVYPDVAELMTVADVLITDYSSIMFDWTVTGKPILYFVPDLERYTSELRGVYFDLAAEAPGPMLASTSEVEEHLVQPSSWSADYAERYSAWQGRYDAWDDGGAAARVVDRLLEGIDARRG